MSGRNTPRTARRTARRPAARLPGPTLPAAAAPRLPIHAPPMPPRHQEDPGQDPETAKPTLNGKLRQRPAPPSQVGPAGLACFTLSWMLQRRRTATIVCVPLVLGPDTLIPTRFTPSGDGCGGGFLCLALSGDPARFP